MEKKWRGKWCLWGTQEMAVGRNFGGKCASCLLDGAAHVLSPQISEQRKSERVFWKWGIYRSSPIRSWCYVKTPRKLIPIWQQRQRETSVWKQDDACFHHCCFTPVQFYQLINQSTKKNMISWLWFFFNWDSFPLSAARVRLFLIYRSIPKGISGDASPFLFFMSEMGKGENVNHP